MHNLGLLREYFLAILKALFPFKEKIGYVQAFSETGVPANRPLRDITRINVYSSSEELQTFQGEQSLGAAVVGRAMANMNTREALALVGESDLQWPQVYNILVRISKEYTSSTCLLTLRNGQLNRSRPELS